MQNPDADYLNYNFNYLVIQTIMKMRDAKADGDKRRYWVYFEFAIQLVLSYLEPGILAYIQKDFDTMEEQIQLIQHDMRIADKTKEVSIDFLHSDFSDRHRYFILKALNKIGIVKVSEDGDIDFDKLDLQLMAQIIRKGHGAEETEQQIASTGGLALKPIENDMTMVVTGGKIFKMGSRDYKEYVNQKLDDKVIEAQAIVETAETQEVIAKAEAVINTPGALDTHPSGAAPDIPNLPDDLPAIGWQPRKKFEPNMPKEEEPDYEEEPPV